MFWIIRKIVVPAVALVFGYFAHAEIASEKCVEAGGQMKSGVCRGVE